MTNRPLTCRRCGTAIIPHRYWDGIWIHAERGGCHTPTVGVVVEGSVIQDEIIWTAAEGFINSGRKEKEEWPDGKKSYIEAMVQSIKGGFDRADRQSPIYHIKQPNTTANVTQTADTHPLRKEWLSQSQCRKERG